MTSLKLFGRFVLILILLLFAGTVIRAQESSEGPAHLYRPQSDRQVQADSVPEQKTAEEYAVPDSLPEPQMIDQDSLQARLKFIEDSIQLRMQFIQDSILAREAFVRDSIARRQRILDSLNLILDQIPKLLDATQKAFSDEIIFRTSKIRIVGDSMLSNYESTMLTFDLASPFTPWKSTINLSTHPPVFSYENGTGRISSIEAPGLSCRYAYGRNDNILVLRTKSSVLSKRTGKLYKEPIDSVFFNRQGRVVKVKKYIQFYEVVKNYQRGRKMFLHLAFVKQFEYDPMGKMTRYEVTKFCDRWQPQAPKKVCNIITYTITPGRNIYKIARKNNPPNEFSDGVFTYEFSSGNTLSSMAFLNFKQTEDWKTIIEVNEGGNVSRYLYMNKGAVNNTLLVNYYLDDPRAKHKVETITCSFDDDGISYYQQNNTTGKSRVRDKMTLEWSEWR